jgi:hypothetical protein
MALESAAPVTEYYLGRGKGLRFLGLTALTPSYADRLEILGALNSWNIQA